MFEQAIALAAEIGEVLRARKRVLATAESCTGGGLGWVVTSVPGSSGWFDRGFVTYSNLSKQEVLGVRPATLQEHGAVSGATVREMAEGALASSHADITVAISGIAGPGGGTPERPVGTVWLAWAGRWFETEVLECRFDGDRQQVRAQAVMAALEGIRARVGGEP